MTKIVIEGLIDPEFVDTEDGGRAKIVQPDDGSTTPFFVRLQSWDETKQHETFESLVGKHVRVTVEVIETENNRETR